MCLMMHAIMFAFNRTYFVIIITEWRETIYLEATRIHLDTTQVWMDTT